MVGPVPASLVKQQDDMRIVSGLLGYAGEMNGEGFGVDAGHDQSVGLTGFRADGTENIEPLVLGLP